VAQSGQTANIALLFLFVLSLAALFVSSLRGHGRFGVYLGFSLAVLAPALIFSSQIFASVFLGQAVSRTLLAGAFLLIFVNTQDPRNSTARRGLALGLVLSADLFTYPGGGLLNIGFAIAFLLAWAISFGLSQSNIVVTFSSDLLRYLLFALTVVVITAFFDSTRLGAYLEFFGRGNITGWPADTVSFGRVLGLSPSATFDSGRALLFLIFVVISSESVIRLRLIRPALSLSSGGDDSPNEGLRSESRREMLPFNMFGRSPQLGLVYLGAFGMALWALAVLRYGGSSYQTWKILAGVQPFIFIGVAMLLFDLVRRVVSLRIRKASRFATIVLLPMVLFLIGGVGFKNIAAHWEITQIVRLSSEVPGEVIINKSKIEAVALTPYLETMVAPAVLDLKDVRFASDTYLGPASPGDECVLLRDSDGLSLRNCGP
jgi:hypothetical protein